MSNPPSAIIPKNVIYRESIKWANNVRPVTKVPLSPAIASRQADLLRDRALKQAVSRTVGSPGGAIAIRQTGVKGFIGRSAAVVKANPVKFVGGPIVALSAVTTLADFMEWQAPGVQNWLTEGWKGATPGSVSVQDVQGRCSVPYIVTSRVERDAQIIFHTTDAQGPIGSLEYAVAGSLFGKNTYNLNVKNLQGVVVRTDYLGPANKPPSGSIARADGGPDNCGQEVSRSVDPQNPVSTTTTPAPQTPEAPPFKVPGSTQNPIPVEKIADYPVQSPSPFRGLDPLGIPLPPPIVGRAPTPTKKTEPEQEQKKFPADPGACSTGCNATLRGGQEAMNDALNRQEAKLNDLLQKFDAAASAEILRKVNTIDEKMGPQIVNATGQKIGLGGKLVSFADSADRWFKRLGGDRALQALTLAASLHNAAMLSNNLGQTLFQAIGQVLAAVGVKDAENNPIDIGKIFGDTVQDFIVKVVGLENYTTLSQVWIRSNRILQAGANIVNSIQSIRFAVMSALENIGAMNARIGNALKKWGVVGDSAYPWFNPSPNYDSKFFQAIETAEQFTSNIDQIASEILSAQESVAQLGQQKTALQNSIENGPEKPLPDNIEQYIKRQQEKAASATPDINPSDFIKFDGQ